MRMSIVGFQPSAICRRTADASRWAGAVLLLAFAGLYLATLDNGLRPGELLGGDLITHQYAQVQGRPSNAPGYPLYTMGGWLWFRLGRLLLGSDANPIAILASYSTLWALVALGLLYALVLEATGRRSGRGNWPVALLVTAFYGVTYFFWYYAVTTEQYASSVAWTVAVVWLMFRWERERRDGYLLAIALLAGVALAHQLTLPIILPPLLWWALRSEPRLVRRPGLIAAAIGLALAPLISYLYVYLAGAAHPEWRGAGEWTSTWDWFWSFVSTAQGRSELTWSWTPFLTAEFPSLIWRELTVPGLIVGLLGWATLGRRPAVSLYATFVLYLILCWVDRLGNWYQVIMPMYALLALGIAAGADWLMAALSLAPFTASPAPPTSPPAPPLRGEGRVTPPSLVGKGVGGLGLRVGKGVGGLGLRVGKGDGGLGLRVGKGVGGSGLRAGKGVGRSGLRAGKRVGRSGASWCYVVLVPLVLLLLYRGALSYPAANARNRPDDTGLAPGWAILADEPPAGAAILGTLPEVAALDYLITIWGRRPDLRIVTSAQARARVAEGQAVMVTREALPLVSQEITAEARYSALGRTLVRVSLAPERNLPPELQPWTHDFGPALRLAGGRLARNAATGEMVVLLAWEARALLTEDWAVSVRLTRGGQEIAQVDHAHPVFAAYPTSRWSAGEVVVDAYPFALGAGVEPDGLTVIVYRQTPDGRFINLDAARFAVR